MEKQIKGKISELQQKYSELGKQLQALVTQKTQIEQQIVITRENMLQVKGAYDELSQLLPKPETKKK